jgi:glycosyltransferase involved in cell wall biosynthesis
VVGKGDEQAGTGAQTANVILVTSSLGCGGAERVLSDMANYWSKLGWQVAFATWSGREVRDFYPLDRRVRREWLDVDSPNDSSVAKLRAHARRKRRLRALVAEIQPDAVLSFIDWSNVVTILATRGLDTRVVVSERVHPAHHPDLARTWKALRKLVYRMADRVVAQTTDVQQWLSSNCGARTETIPNPLRDLPLMHCERQPMILGVGRLRPQKGFDLLLRAFAEARRHFTGWRVLIVGAGPERDALMKLARELGIDACVEIVEPRKDIEVLMASAGIVVQPSRFEGFPNVVLEAMGMGAPVIAADCQSGPSEIIEDGVNGRLVPVEDVDELANAMTDLMSQPHLRARLGAAAKSVRWRFGQEQIMNMWEQCLVPSRSGEAFDRGERD